MRLVSLIFLMYVRRYDKKRNQTDAGRDERLRADNARLQSEMIRLVGRNLALSEQLEVDVELRRRSDVARALMEENIER